MTKSFLYGLAGRCHRQNAHQGAAPPPVFSAPLSFLIVLKVYKTLGTTQVDNLKNIVLNRDISMGLVKMTWFDKVHPHVVKGYLWTSSSWVTNSDTMC